MATHSSVLAWRIPGAEEPGGLPSMGSHRVGHDWSDLAAAAATLLSLRKFQKLEELCARIRDKIKYIFLTKNHSISDETDLFRTSFLNDSFGYTVLGWPGFPGGTSGQEPACQCRRHKRLRFDPWVGKIPCRRAWQPTPVFQPGESYGQRSLAGHGP